MSEGDNSILINGARVRLLHTTSPEQIDYTQYNISNAIVVDNTGVWRDRKGLGRHLKAPGVSQVLLTAPGKEDIPNIVAGVNDSLIEPLLSTSNPSSGTSTPTKGGGRSSPSASSGALASKLHRQALMAAANKAASSAVNGSDSSGNGSRDDQQLLLPTSQSIYSAVSCTTNAVVPILSALLTKYNIESGHLETVHSYTNDQNLLDNFHHKSR